MVCRRESMSPIYSFLAFISHEPSRESHIHGGLAAVTRPFVALVIHVMFAVLPSAHSASPVRAVGTAHVYTCKRCCRFHNV